jgi:preprotein translocase subunit SecA
MEDPRDIHQAEVEKTDMSHMVSNREEIDDAGVAYGVSKNDMYTSSSTAPVRQAPVRNMEPKIGRNDACPCGSGKKFKQCHGK